MIQWWKDNFKWAIWVVGIVWGTFTFAVGHYVSFQETKAEFKSLKEINQLTLQALEKFDARFSKLEDYLLYKDRQ